MSYTLQLSGEENVWLSDTDGVLQMFGTKIAETEDERDGGTVGIQYPPEFALQLLEFLKQHEGNILLAMGADIPSDKGWQTWSYHGDEDSDPDKEYDE